MSQLGVLTQTTLLSATTGTMPGFLLSVWQKKLILPSTSVLEVLPGSRLQSGKKKKSGLLGMIAWQDGTIPVVSFEVFNGASNPVEPQKIAVFHAVSISDKYPQYGVALQSDPESVKIKISELEDLEKAVVGPMEFMQVRYKGELAVIPDLDAIESKLLSLM